MNLLNRIKKTYSYGLIFGYKRSLPEIIKWLISPKRVRGHQIKEVITANKLNFKVKIKKNKHAHFKKNLSKKYLRFLSHLPTIEFIGLTGSVSANNAKSYDDIDLLIICSPNTLWLTRPIVLLYLEIIQKRRKWKTPKNRQKDLFCTNLWLDSNNLSIPNEQRNLYTAHEALQVYPLFDQNSIFRKFLLKNKWVKRFLNNAYRLTLKRQKNSNKSTQKNNYYLYPLNYLSFVIQYFFMLGHHKGEIVEIGRAYFHDQSFSGMVLKKHYNKD